jgi:hypothetical protein
MDRERAQLHPRVATVLAAAAAPAEVPMPGEAAALAAFRRAHTPGRSRRLRLSMTGRLAVAGTLGGLLMAGGVAAAATGTLPSVTSFGSLHQPHPVASTTSVISVAAAPVDAQIPAGYSGEVPYDAPGYGARISDLATSTVTRGVAKGATVCAAASHVTCRAGLAGGSRADGTHRPTTSTASTHGSARASHPSAATAGEPSTHRRAVDAPASPPGSAPWTHFPLRH